MYIVSVMFAARRASFGAHVAAPPRVPIAHPFRCETAHAALARRWLRLEYHCCARCDAGGRCRTGGVSAATVPGAGGVIDGMRRTLTLNAINQGSC